MKTFLGWRAVGRAMRWARQQDGVRQERKHGGISRQHRWYGPGDGPIVGITWGGAMLFDLDVYLPVGTTCELAASDDAAQVLRVLAALRLIPDELADVRDERFGRCKTCNASCMWVPGEPGMWPGRWLHVRPYHGVDHRAEVAE